MRNLYIHCGLPKSGTTSIQKSLAAGREQLRAAGYDYPDICVSADRTAHHNLAREMLGDPRFVAERGGRDELLAYFKENTRCPNIVLSSEGLTHCLFRARAQLFGFLQAAMTANDAVFVAFTFREFWRISESTYLYNLRNGGGDTAGSGPLRLAATTKWLKGLSEGLSAMRDLVGAERFLVCDVVKDGEDSVSAISTLLGVPYLRQRSAEPRYNSRIGIKKSAILYKLRNQAASDRAGAVLSPEQIAKIRRRILAMPDFPGEIFDYRIMPYDGANAIQAVAREVLPHFVTGKLDQSLRPEINPYAAVRLENVELNREELDAVWSAVPHKFCVRLPWLAREGLHQA